MQIAVHKLNLELVGTAMGNIKDARAFIKDLETGRQGIYKVGSMVQEAKVIRIAMGEVALEVNGREEILRLSDRGKQWAHVREAGAPITCVSDNLYAVNRQGLMHEAGTFLKTMQQVKVKPYYEENKVCGLRVEGVPEDFSFGEISPDWERMAPDVEKAMSRVPVSAELGVKKFSCGPESLTPDLLKNPNI